MIIVAKYLNKLDCIKNYNMINCIQVEGKDSHTKRDRAKKEIYV